MLLKRWQSPWKIPFFDKVVGCRPAGTSLDERPGACLWYNTFRKICKRKKCQFYILLNHVFCFEIISSFSGFGFYAIFWGKIGNIARSRCNPILTTSTERVTMSRNFSPFLGTLIAFADQWFLFLKIPYQNIPFSF